MPPHEALRAWLDAENIKPGAFARSIEYDRGNFHRLLKGDFKPSLELAHKIEQETRGEIRMSLWAAAA